MEQTGVTSSASLLQRVGTMFGLKDSNWYGDGIDWIGDAIEGIGYHCGFDERTLDLEIKNYRVAIPSCVESIRYIEHEGHRLPLGVDESDYGFVRFKQKEKPNILHYNEMLSLGKLIDNLNALMTIQLANPNQPGILEQIENTNFQINVILDSKYLAGNVGFWNHHFYNIDSEVQYIKTSFDCGWIKVKCRTFRVDSKGLPLVLNTFKYKEAVSWFLISRLLLSGKRHPVIKWEEANEQWDGIHGFRNQAANEGKMFSIDEMERFKNRWTSIKRDAQLSQY